MKCVIKTKEHFGRSVIARVCWRIWLLSILAGCLLSWGVRWVWVVHSHQWRHSRWRVVVWQWQGSNLIMKSWHEARSLGAGWYLSLNPWNIICSFTFHYDHLIFDILLLSVISSGSLFRYGVWRHRSNCQS